MRTDSNDIPKLPELGLVNIDTDKEWERFCANVGIKPREPKVFSLKSTLKIAASVALVLGLSFFAYRMTDRTQQNIFTAQNSAVEAVVENSTQISLNKNSSVVCTKENDGLFSVELKGEAYFDVEKNPNRVFQILTGDITVTVKGTSFDICEENSKTVVTVTSGNVEVKSNLTGKIVCNLTKGKQLVCSKDGLMQVSEAENFNSIAWKLKKFDFREAKLSDIMFQLSRAYGFDYRFEDAELQNEVMTGSFDNQSLDAVLNVIGQALDVKIVKTEGSVKIGK
jgi:ferric-dicitrate binding protein FerR (iron transport regulator)